MGLGGVGVVLVVVLVTILLRRPRRSNRNVRLGDKWYQLPHTGYVPSPGENFWLTVLPLNTFLLSLRHWQQNKALSMMTPMSLAASVVASAPRNWMCCPSCVLI